MGLLIRDLLVKRLQGHEGDLWYENEGGHKALR